MTGSGIEEEPLVLARDDRFVLRVCLDADRQRWFEALHDPAQVALGAPAFVEPVRDPDDLRERVASSAADLAVLRPGTLVVAERADDRLVATVSWRRDVPPQMETVDVGYLVHPAERRRGAGTAAVRLLSWWLTAAPSGPGQARVQLDHSVENTGSCRVATAAGFAQEGVRRGFLPLRDPQSPGGVRRHDVCLHGRLRDD